MALRLIRLLAPRGAAAVRATSTVPKAGMHLSATRPLKYGWLAYMLGERTTPRLHHLSRIISMDGNLDGSGELGPKLAESLGMRYMPEVDPNYLDLLLGEESPLGEEFNGMCNVQKFYEDPKAPDGNAIRLQVWIYVMRLIQYSQAVLHLLTTGQGVVLERSPFSDVVFLEAMSKQGYVRNECVHYFHEIKDISLCEFLPPHLVVYLDIPAEEVQRRLSNSSQAHLQKVPLPYLRSIEESYKKTFLPRMSKSSEILIYDATQALDVEQVAEDVECLQFDKGPWLEQNDVTYHHMRMLVQDPHRVAGLANIPKFLPELTIEAQKYDYLYYAYKSLPGKKYSVGYNADIGDKNIWLK